MSTALFLMAHYADSAGSNEQFLEATLDSIFAQTDRNWFLLVIDDASPSIRGVQRLQRLQSTYPDKVHVIYNDQNRGPGASRNIGVRWAQQHRFPFTLYIDHDDVCHERRVEVTRGIFNADAQASVVYSTFHVIDENGKLTPEERLTPSIREIHESHKGCPPRGKNAWIDMGTRTGYTNLTSSTAVRTELAAEYPFPGFSVSEDLHTWYRYSAGGNDFVYTEAIPSLYRVVNGAAGSASRSREGRHEFYEKKARVDELGFKEAIDIALQRGKIASSDVDMLLIRFYLKQWRTFHLENEREIELSQLVKAYDISRDKTLRELQVGI